MTADVPKVPFLRQSGREFVDPATGELRRPRAFMHYCQHPGCKEWGSYGFGVRLRAKNQPGRWFCKEHKADGLKD